MNICFHYCGSLIASFFLFFFLTNSVSKTKSVKRERTKGTFFFSLHLHFGVYIKDIGVYIKDISVYIKDISIVCQSVCVSHGQDHQVGK